VFWDPQPLPSSSDTRWFWSTPVSRREITPQQLAKLVMDFRDYLQNDPRFIGSTQIEEMSKTYMAEVLKDYIVVGEVKEQE
jgi:hypothetical protein